MFRQVSFYTIVFFSIIIYLFIYLCHHTYLFKHENKSFECAVIFLHSAIYMFQAAIGLTTYDIRLIHQSFFLFDLFHNYHYRSVLDL